MKRKSFVNHMALVAGGMLCPFPTELIAKVNRPVSNILVGKILTLKELLGVTNKTNETVSNRA